LKKIVNFCDETIDFIDSKHSLIIVDIFRCPIIATFFNKFFAKSSRENYLQQKSVTNEGWRSVWHLIFLFFSKKVKKMRFLGVSIFAPKLAILVHDHFCQKK
jgi:hypothetical protein